MLHIVQSKARNESAEQPRCPPRHPERSAEHKARHAVEGSCSVTIGFAYKNAGMTAPQSLFGGLGRFFDMPHERRLRMTLRRQTPHVISSGARDKPVRSREISGVCDKSPISVCGPMFIAKTCVQCERFLRFARRSASRFGRNDSGGGILVLLSAQWVC